MISQPEVYLDDLTAAEKAALTAAARKKMVTMGILLLPPALILVAVLIYVNNYKHSLHLNDDTLNYLNPVTVLAIVLPIRFFVGYILSYRKESRSWQKRVVHGRIHGIKGNSVFIGKQKVALDSKHISLVAVDDEVEIAVSIHAGYVIYVNKKQAPQEEKKED